VKRCIGCRHFIRKSRHKSFGNTARRSAPQLGERRRHAAADRLGACGLFLVLAQALAVVAVAALLRLRAGCGALSVRRMVRAMRLRLGPLPAP
jgi:hypothetical protein